MDLTARGVGLLAGRSRAGMPVPWTQREPARAFTSPQRVLGGHRKDDVEERQKLFTLLVTGVTFWVSNPVW